MNHTLRVSVSTIAYDGYDLEVTLNQLSQLGVQYVELDAIEGLSEHITSLDLEDSGFAEKISSIMTELGLRSLAFSGHIDLTREGAVPDFEKRMRFARNLGVKIINTFSGPVEKIDNFYKNIAAIDKIAKSLDLMVALETHGDIISDKSSLEAIEKINSDNIKVNYDFVNTFHAAEGKIDIEEDFKSMLLHIVYLHLKDTRIQADIWEFPQIGTGIMDYRNIFKVLKHSKKNIPLCIELPLRLEKEKGGPPAKTKPRPKIEQINSAVSGSLEYVKELWESV